MTAFVFIILHCIHQCIIDAEVYGFFMFCIHHFVYFFLQVRTKKKDKVLVVEVLVIQTVPLYLY